MHPQDPIRVEGRCLCGGVHYTIEAALQGFAHCHCQRCRKHFGATFASFAMFDRAGGAWTAGRDQLNAFDSKDLLPARAFCSVCGSTMPHPATLESATSAIAGNTLGLPAPPLEYHFYLGNRSPWCEAPRGTPHAYAVVHPGWRDPGLSDLHRPTSDDTLCGSCLCGDVRFEARSSGVLMHCHCSLCRLASAAAFATTLAVNASEFAWKSGQQQVTSYDLRDPVDFGCAFCRRCGSAVPRPRAGQVDIPAGCLDSAPGIRAAGHMYVGSKAPWYRIEDDLPRWEGPSPWSTHAGDDAQRRTAD